ncbi:MAG: SDR family NAD(P)-dependent oxidoreductase, partial [bacterium]
PAVLETIEKLKAKYGEALESEDIADAILHAVTAPPRVNVNEVLIRPLGQVS